MKNSDDKGVLVEGNVSFRGALDEYVQHEKITFPCILSAYAPRDPRFTKKKNKGVENGFTREKYLNSHLHATQKQRKDWKILFMGYCFYECLGTN